MTDEKYLIYKSQIEQDVDAERPALHLGDPMFLSERFVVYGCERNNEFLAFKVLDLFTGESRLVKFYTQNSQYLSIGINWLNSDYGLIIGQSNETHFVNLVKIDWTLNEFQTVEQFKRNGQDLWIFPDALDPSKFLLRVQVGNVHNHQICNVVEGKIHFGDVYQSQMSLFYHFDEKLFGLFQRGRQFRIKIFDLATKEEERVETGPLPDNVNLCEYLSSAYGRFYKSVYYQNTYRYGVAWLDLKTYQWKLLIDFELDLPIEKLDFVNGNLLVHTEESDEQDGIFSSTKKFYGIQMRRPQLLRDSAWLLMIKTMKEKGEDDPYGAASKYLPFNTDLRSPWFVDKGENDEKSAEEKHSQSTGSQNEASDAESSQNSASSTEDQCVEAQNEQVQDQEKQIDETPAKRFKSD